MSFPLLDGDHVTDDAGTGFVHTAPGHGREDFELWTASTRLLQELGIETRIPYTVDENGAFTEEAPGFEGKRVITDRGKSGDANKAVIDALIKAGALVARGRLKHQYPHSWRSKTPVIFRNTPQWFLAMDRPFANREGGKTLRAIAVEAIERTRWAPPSGENRIKGMVANKPDWVLSRQRAWGVPLSIFVRKDGDEILFDEEVNGRIAAAYEQEGADAWFANGAKERFLGAKHDADAYDKVDDLVEVWFDSGSTHAYVLEDAKHFPGLAGIRRTIDGGEDQVMYLEGSDQHRGWFQSSLLESCGTRGRAPFDIVLTHGFTLDEIGRKMSKSLGNQTFPADVIRASGADILRLWVASVDYTDDQRIGPEILKAVSDNYRKLRNTIRWMLGTLAHREAGDSIGHAAMGGLERLMLHKLAELDPKIRETYDNFDFARVVAALTAFMNSDLSAFYFDIRKDALYCDAPSSVRRRGALEAIEHIFGAVAIWFAPVLVFTAEEAWTARAAGRRSIHLEQFPAIPSAWRDDELAKTWDTIRMLRLAVTGAIEIARANKLIGSSLEAAPRIYLSNPEHTEGARRSRLCGSLHHFRHYGGVRGSDPRGGFSAARSSGRWRDRRARERGQMRPFVALLRSCIRFAGISRRQPKGRRGVARAQIAGPLAVKPPALGGIVALVVVIVDQITKIAVLSRSDQLAVDSTPLTPFLDLTLQWNRGISFSLFARNSASAETVLLALTLAATALLAWWLARSRPRLPAAGLGLIIGGALGNAIDRIFHGAVVDYLDLHAFGRHFFVFNVADAAINIGVVLLIIDLLPIPRAPDSQSPPHGAS